MSVNISNSTTAEPFVETSTIFDINRNETITKDDCAWILSNAFLVLTMQSGFGLLEAGCVSSKNIANIMVKNVVDVTLGGLSYWTFGYGLSFGRPSNWFCGFGDFFVKTDDETLMGSFYTKYVFQFSFATAATTIVSGAIAERMKLTAYMVFSVVNTFVYCFPASWAWNKTGFLYNLGFFDFAGSCVVHLTGGASALVASLMVGARLGRFGDNDRYQMSSPVTALTGTFMLWWAWLGFNCGSTFGIDGHLWKIAAKVAVNTLNGSVGGGIVGLMASAVVSRGRCYDIGYIISSVLGGLVGVTAACAVISPAESLFLGGCGAGMAIAVTHLMTYLRVDDPVGAFPVHYGAACVGTIGVGLFGRNDFNLLHGHNGVFQGGGLYLLGVQLLGLFVMTVWSASLTAVAFMVMEATIGVRVKPEEEILGADWVEHRVRSVNFADKLEKTFEELALQDDSINDIVKKLLLEVRGTHDHQRPVSARVRNMTVNDARRQSDLERHVHHELGKFYGVTAAASAVADPAVPSASGVVSAVVAEAIAAEMMHHNTDGGVLRAVPSGSNAGGDDSRRDSGGLRGIPSTVGHRNQFDEARLQLPGQLEAIKLKGEKKRKKQKDRANREAAQKHDKETAAAAKQQIPRSRRFSKKTVRVEDSSSTTKIVPADEREVEDEPESFSWHIGGDYDSGASHNQEGGGAALPL